MIDCLNDLKSSWSYIVESGKKVLVYGMGNGADKVINKLNNLGVDIIGVTASDNFVRGQTFRGFSVKKINEFCGDFILLPAFGSNIKSVISHICSLDKQYDLIYPVVPVVGDVLFDDEFVSESEDKIIAASKLFSGRSKDVYENIIRFLYSGKLNYLFKATEEKDEIFNSFMQLSGNETYIDVGAYKGDTVYEYLKYTSGDSKRIIAIEPDYKNYIKLKENCKLIKNTEFINAAVSDKVGETEFSSLGGRQSHIGKTGNYIQCITIDSLLTLTETEDYYIKIDAEGEEMNIISGAQYIIKRCRPKMNTALYHKFSDLFEIPLKLNELNPEYKFEIRHHPYIPAWDTNLYCV